MKYEVDFYARLSYVGCFLIRMDFFTIAHTTVVVVSAIIKSIKRDAHFHEVFHDLINRVCFKLKHSLLFKVKNK